MMWWPSQDHRTCDSSIIMTLFQCATFCGQVLLFISVYMKYDKYIHTCRIFRCGSCSVLILKQYIYIKTSLITSDRHVFMIGLKLLWKLCCACVLSCLVTPSSAVTPSVSECLRVSQSVFRIFRSMCSPFCCQIVAYVSIFSTRLFSSSLCLYVRDSICNHYILKLNWTLHLCGEKRKRKSLFII